MLIYTFPLLIIGITGMVNEVIDKIIFKYLAPVPPGIENTHNYIMGELGVYGANFKLAVLMTLFIQMFRYAAEPFFFSTAKESNAKYVYADVMKYFILFGLMIFLGVTLFIDVFKYFIGPEHWGGLHIVPIVLIANLFQGIFYNLSIWYKLTDMTRYGAMIALLGSVITIAANIVLVPVMSYAGAAWGHLMCYLFMIIVSFYWGKKHYPIPYDTKTILFYLASAMILYAAASLLKPEALFYRLLLNTLLLVFFVVTVVLNEKKRSKKIIS
jgi:O-antigen/teichoic acid export membrane protein